ncbi:ROK family protein, partial [Escherichia coli]
LYGSGQIGHTIVNPDGVVCDCGRYGCLETVASLSALKNRRGYCKRRCYSACLRSAYLWRRR